ncbi:MAG: HAD-IC family P-type ATPase, partial [Gammaproteobacteria bacterium]|nr:HAD-IC family P-type ATPase [Gammaproteobacteria bacterium]
MPTEKPPTSHSTIASSNPQHDTTATGLTTAEAAARLAAEGPNLLPGTKPVSNLALIGKVLTEPMFLMLLAAGAIYLALGNRTEALLLLGFVFMVIGITLLEERKTQRALESLRDLSAPRALVIRDQQQLRIAARDLVRGDILILREGDRIAADALLLQGNLTVDESLLTGEAVPVQKLVAAGSKATMTADAPPQGDTTPTNTQDPPTDTRLAKRNSASSSATSKAELATADADSHKLFASTVVTSGLGQAQVCA